jgi:hypothetical protein
MTLPSDTADHLPVPEPEGASTDSPAAEPPAPPVSIEDLTLGQALGQLLRAPAATFRALTAVIRPSETASKSVAVPLPVMTPAAPVVERPSFRLSLPAIAAQPMDAYQRMVQIAALVVRVFAFGIGLNGSVIVAASRTNDSGLHLGGLWLIAAFIIWLFSELLESWPRLTGKALSRSDSGESGAGGQGAAQAAIPFTTTRIIVAGAALLFTAGASAYNAGNRFTSLGVICWFLSIGLWVWVFAPPGWSLGAVWGRLRSFRLRSSWTLWALLLILALATWFRFEGIERVPPEMTSDHVEKILDAQNILNGVPQVFFPNNGGRDPLHFYLLAFSSALTGIPITFTYLKVATALEGILSILLMWWMAREVFGQKERDLGDLVGLILALLVAVSYWHESLSRLGLRIILTVCFTALLVLYLARAMRSNQRGDFIKAGLVLGISLYAYQVTRIFPVLVALAVGLMLTWAFIGWLRDRSRQPHFRRTLANALVLTVIVAAVFVPMATFIRQYPEDYLRRTTGRLLGDDLIQETDAAGNIVTRVPSDEERAAALNRNLGILLDNVRRALLMYNWNGDIAWINAASNRPAMDIITGTLLILGSSAWLARMIRRRDPVDWFMPIGFFVLIFPSALSIAYPIENPSATRMSGTLAFVYLAAAYPLALVVRSLWQVFNWRGLAVAGVTTLVLVSTAFAANRETYFGDYYRGYMGSSLPYSEPGRILKGFAESSGSYGNAFMIAYLYWWDHRAVGLEAGLYDWPGGIISVDEVPRTIFAGLNRADQYTLDPDKQLLFFVNRADDITLDRLRSWFPASYQQLVESYQPEDSFIVVWVPPLGLDGLDAFLSATGELQ